MNIHLDKMRTLCATLLLASAVPALHAQDDGLRLHFDFAQASGTSVPDAASSGITAKLMNEATVKEMGKYHVLSLGNGTGYLDMTSKAGTLFRSLDTLTISMYYRVDEDATISGAGNWLWTFCTSSACSSTTGKYSAYRLNAQRFAVTTGGGNNETAIQIGSESEKGCWIHVAYTQAGNKASLYLNGEKMRSSTSMPVNSENFTTAITYARIGWPSYTSDSYLKQTLVNDIRLYDRVLTDDEISAMATETDSLDYEYRYGTTGDFTTLRETLQEAEDYLSANESAYPAAAVLICQDEMNRARDLVDEGLVNQDLVDEEVSLLTSALATLKATAGFSLDLSGTAGGYDTDRGFRHPGGLHTSADFARIRQQLADGNETVTAAYNVLKEAYYAQSSTATSPVETIIRGGSGENYMNAARGATIAYQNGLRWQIDGSKANAKHAVDVLMQWARTTTGIGGDSNYALGAGIYGYEFAQAAELVRDYEGWSEEDFATFKQWLLDVWYPSCIGFLRWRNGTWANTSKWWQCPGHYWSNWGLCNALAVMSIGLVCDDVFIYNQGLSFFKYDQVGTFQDPRTANPILNDGLNEFLGNLVVTTDSSSLETGAYGKLGQMQESGRDTGHCAMAAGLAVDIAQMGWNQGDDLFSYMDHRLAAGIEYVAAQMQSISGLPWTNYHYATNGYYWSDSRAWLQTGPALGEQIRPYWGTVIGHYEGVKGVKMPFSEWCYEQMGIDGGGAGSTSGGYDHLGYSVLTHTMGGLASAEQVPTPLTPRMEYNGKTVEHNELGGLTNTYETKPTTALPAGTIVTLSPQLPDGEADTGQWQWNTGENTKDLTITADHSGVWRATYTNAHGVESEQVFTIAVEGDCTESALYTYITAGGERQQTSSVSVLYGSEVTLELYGQTGWGYYEWEDGSTSSTLTLPYVTTSRDIMGVFISQGGRRQAATFHIEVATARPDITVGKVTYEDTLLAIVDEGSDITLQVTTTDYPTGGTFLWSDGSTGSSLQLDSLQTSGTYSVDYTLDGQTTTFLFQVYVQESDYREFPIGDYYLLHEPTGYYLTNPGDGTSVRFMPRDDEASEAQIWHLEYKSPALSYNMCSLLDSTYLQTSGQTGTSKLKRFRFKGAAGLDNVAVLSYPNSGNKYWQAADDGIIDFAASAEPSGFPFLLVPTEATAIGGIASGELRTAGIRYYTPSGQRLGKPARGINIRQRTLANGQTVTDKILVP